jgi:maltose alpha-D-glucosyltransferase/alpha-amylase
VVGDALAGPTPLHRLSTSSNSISLLGDTLVLKCYRRLQSGLSAELEMGRFLTDVAGYRHCVPVAGSMAFHAKDGSVWPLALLQAQVVHQGDAWAFSIDQLSRLLESQHDGTEQSHKGIAAMTERMQLLARRIAELHVALAKRSGALAFDPEPIVGADLARWSTDARADCRRTLALLGERGAALAEPLATLARRVVAAAKALAARLVGVASARPVGLKTRVHGDLHLQHVLVRADDFMVIDFKGDPQRTLDERRAKQSALRDVAGMLRSFDYARHTALQQTAQSDTELAALAPVARQWEQRMREAFMSSYREVAVAGGLYASAADFDAARPLLELFELERALSELRHDLDHRPDWVGVPLAAVAALAGVTG